MSCSSNVSRAAEKIQPTLKNKEKVEANCTGFSVEYFGSQSLEMQAFRNVLFCQESKNSNADNFFPELDKNPPTSS